MPSGVERTPLDYLSFALTAFQGESSKFPRSPSRAFPDIGLSQNGGIGISSSEPRGASKDDWTMAPVSTGLFSDRLIQRTFLNLTLAAFCCYASCVEREPE
jgi:hypothetical protein